MKIITTFASETNLQTLKNYTIMNCTSIEKLASQTPTEYFIAYVHDAEINQCYYALFQKEDLEPIRGSKDLDIILRHCFFRGVSINNCTIYDKYSRVYSLR